MKTLRLIGMAMFAVLMCVNFASCSGNSDDDPTEEEGGVVVSGKKIAKIIGSGISYTFSYDSKGRLIEAIETEKEDNEEDVANYTFIWGDDAVQVSEKRSWSNNTNTYVNTYVLSLTNGLVRESSEGETYIYSQSSRLVKLSNEYWTTSAIWDNNKLVSISDSDGEATLTYEKSCEKGYSPFTGILTFREYNCEPLLMAHPEIVGLRTTQLPASLTWDGGEYTTVFTYEFDKEGYISKITGKKTDYDGSTETYTYTLTWQ